MFVSTGLFKHFTVPTFQNGPFTYIYISCWTADTQHLNAYNKRPEQIKLGFRTCWTFLH